MERKEKERKTKPLMKSDTFKAELKENKFAFSKKGNITKIEFTKKNNLLKKGIIKEITNLISKISSSEELVKKLSKKLRIEVNAKEIEGVKTLVFKESITTLLLEIRRWDDFYKYLEIDRIGNNAKVEGEEICHENMHKKGYIPKWVKTSKRASNELNELSTKHLLDILKILEKSKT